MTVKIKRNILSESHAREPVKFHDVLYQVICVRLSFSKIALRISFVLIEFIGSAMAGHIHSADMIARIIEVSDKLLITGKILSHSVADLDNAFYLGSR